MNTEEGTYPVHWDLTEIYADAEAWQQDYDKAYAMLDEYDSFAGKMNNAGDIRAYMDFCYGGELTETESRLHLYATLGNSLNAADDTYNTMLNKFNSLVAQEGIKNAFFQKELLSIPYEERIKILDDPLLENYTVHLYAYRNPNLEAKSEETVRSEQTLLQSYDLGSDVMEAMLYLDMPNPKITLPDGTTEELDDSVYSQIMSDKQMDRETKKEAYALRIQKLEPYANIAAAALEGTVKENCSKSEINGFDTMKEYAVNQEAVDAVVYDKMLDGAHSMTSDYQRYLKIRQEALGLDEQYSYDLYSNISNYERELTDYDDAVDEVRDALKIYGDDYIAYYDDMIKNHHVDVYSADGKNTGAFMQDSATDVLPYVLFNYDGSFQAVSTVAHEMGHAVYGAYTQTNQDTENKVADVFTQEVASTLNELIFVNSAFENASSADEKLYYLEEEINLLNNTLLYQAQLAEFEDELYQLVEDGESLSADRLNELWKQIETTYEGDAVISHTDKKMHG